MSAKIIEGLGLLVGVIVGAGLFALPYGFSKSGPVWGLALFVLVLAASVLLHLLYDAVIYHTPGRHRFAGYARRYLGRKAEILILVFNFFAYYGAMLAYGILGSIFLKNIFGTSAFWGGVLFFIAGGFLFSLSLSLVGKINFYLTLPLLAFILFLAWRLFPHFSSASLAAPVAPSRFFPYGILLFSFSGYSALPDLHDVLGPNRRALSKKIILWSFFLAAVFYLIFIFAVLGASGSKTSVDALSGLGILEGKSVVAVGSLIGLLAVFTSYVVFGADLKMTFRYDYGWSETFSWLLSFLPPLFLYLAGFTNLEKILSLVGSVALGVFAIFILFIAWREREGLSSFLGFRLRAWWILALGLLVALGALEDAFSILWK